MKNALSEIDFSITLLALMVALGTMGLLGLPVFAAGAVTLSAIVHHMNKRSVKR
jgi:hypothetical protein